MGILFLAPFCRDAGVELRTLPGLLQAFYPILMIEAPGANPRSFIRSSAQ